MKLKHISINSCLAAAILFGGSVACTDDHYDVQSPQNGGNVTESLWDIISKTPELSEFAEVCSQALFYTDEVTPSKNGYTFADLLKGNSQLTVFAPVNGTFDKDAMLRMAKENGYDLQNQFLGNHIARFRYEVAGHEAQNMNMLNGKILPMDNEAHTLGGSHMAGINTPAKNGVLHIMEDKAPFTMSIYEYLRNNASSSYVANFFCTGDTAYFLASSSVEGDIDPVTGQMVYLDSMFYRTNNYYSSAFLLEYLNGVELKERYVLPATGAKLATEDSSYVAIIPSNNAWLKAMETYRKATRLAPVYADNTTRDMSTSSTDSRMKGVKETEMQEVLSEMMARTYLQSVLFFNLGNDMRKDVTLTLDNFDSRKSNLLAFVNTKSDTLRSLPYAENRNQDIPVENDVLGSDYDSEREWDLKSIFDNKTPLRMSNGLVYEVDNFNLDTRLVLKRDVRIEGERYNNLYLTGVSGKHGGQGGLSASEEDGMWERFGEPAERLTQKYGKLSGGYGYSSGGASAATTYVTYALKGNIFAGKYDIYVVTVPYAMVKDDSTLVTTDCTFEAALAYVTDKGPESDKLGDLPKLKNEKDGGTTFTASGAKVDTVLLARDFEFPYSYVGMDDSWPSLQFKVTPVRYPDITQKRARFAVDFIYLKAKED